MGKGVAPTRRAPHTWRLGLGIVLVIVAMIGAWAGGPAEATAVMATTAATPSMSVYTYDSATASTIPAANTHLGAPLSEHETAAASQRSTPWNPRFIAANGVEAELPGLLATAPKPLGLGSTGRVTPGNLSEQLAMTEVRSAPGGQIIRVTMSDARWPAADGWVKMAQNVNGVEVHYVRNTVTGAVDDFKFAGAG